MHAMTPIALLAGMAILLPPSANAGGHPELTAADQAFSMENYELAARLYRRDAEIGVTAAQLNLAYMYLDGQGVPQDPSQAASWFQRAAEQGSAEARQMLGTLYRDGKGVAASDVEAAKWFLAAGADGEVKVLEQRLSSQQLSEARQLADTWLAKFGKARSR